MQALAPTGSVAGTEAVEKLCTGYFTFKPLGPTCVKGMTEPINVFEVTGLGPLRTRLQRAAGRGLTKFVDREREIEALKHAAELARQGHGQNRRTYLSDLWLYPIRGITHIGCGWYRYAFSQLAKS
jgi:hypothetical protein